MGEWFGLGFALGIGVDCANADELKIGALKIDDANKRAANNLVNDWVVSICLLFYLGIDI